MYAWNKFVEKLKHEMGGAVINKWIASLKLIKFDACNIYLEAKDTFQANWLEEHVLLKAKQELVNSNNHPIKIHIKVKNNNDQHLDEEKDRKKPSPIDFKPDSLDENNTFSSFYEDINNSLCFKFLSNIAKDSLMVESSEIELASFNPILIYGPSACGKTHLLMACAKAFRLLGKNSFYIKSQTFTSHVVNAYRLSSLHEFRETYRNVDILIIDDVHLFAGKSATQEELFHTFNTLHSQGNQIIISSNIPPRELKEMEQRLISRFEWGITLSLTRPDKIGLSKILDTKEKIYSLNFDSESKAFLLNIFSNAKEIEQAMQAIILRRSKNEDQTKLNLALTQSYLTDLISEKQKNSLSATMIVDVISKHFGIFSNDILGKSQTKECALPRQIAMYFCRTKLNMAFQKIGGLFNRDHSTVMTSVKFIEKSKLEKSSDIYYTLLDVEKKLSS